MRSKLFFIFALVFINTLAMAEETEDSTAPLTLIPKLSLVTPSTILLANNNFNLPSNNNVQGLPLINVLVSRHWFSFQGMDVDLQAGIGYGFRQQIVDIQAAAGSKSDVMGLHIIPLSASLKAIYSIPHFSDVRPGVELGGGMYWLLQNASATVGSDAFWLPFLRVSPSLTFFESSYEKGDWWGGFCFGISYQTSVAGRGTFQAWSFDLSTNIIL